MYLRFDRAVYEQLKSSGAEISGEYGITAYRFGETSWMAAGGSTFAPLVGRCSSGVVEDRWSGDMLKVQCESPSAIPIPTRVRLWDPQSGREWKQALGDSAPGVTGPRGTWLSALDRRQTFFHLAESPRGMGSQWVVPTSALAASKIAITPEIVTGYSVLRYNFRDVVLSRYVVQPVQR
jgi:hypothetical protein